MTPSLDLQKVTADCSEAAQGVLGMKNPSIGYIRNCSSLTSMHPTVTSVSQQRLTIPLQHWGLPMSPPSITTEGVTCIGSLPMSTSASATSLASLITTFLRQPDHH